MDPEELPDDLHELIKQLASKTNKISEIFRALVENMKSLSAGGGDDGGDDPSDSDSGVKSDSTITSNFRKGGKGGGSGPWLKLKKLHKWINPPIFKGLTGEILVYIDVACVKNT